MKQCRQFLEGLHFDLITDHRSLVPILNDYALDKLDNQRLLRLRLKMSRYTFTAKWVPHKLNVEADAVSRSPISYGSVDDVLVEGPSTFTARTVVVGIISGSAPSAVDSTLEKVKAAAALDPVMSALRNTILLGFPNDKCNLPLALRPFWDVRHRLAIDDDDDMIVLDARVVIPRALVTETLRTLFGMYQDASACSSFGLLAPHGHRHCQRRRYSSANGTSLGVHLHRITLNLTAARRPRSNP